MLDIYDLGYFSKLSHSPDTAPLAIQGFDVGLVKPGFDAALESGLTGLCWARGVNLALPVLPPTRSECG